MKPLRTAALSALLALPLLSACGEDPKPPPPDAGLEDPEAYFSLQKGRCFEYTLGDAKQVQPALGMAVEELDETTFAVPTYVVVYRTASIAMKDWVSVEDDALKLHKRYLLGEGKEILYTPPLTLLQAPIKAGAKVESKARTTIYESGSLVADEEHSLRVDVFEPNTERLPFGTDVSSYAVNFDETPDIGRAEVRNFVPGTGDRAAPEGWVKISYNFGPDPSASPLVYKLQGIRELSEEPGSAWCGSAP